MTLYAHSLASGSSGNSIFISHEGTSLLLDAGLSARALQAALEARSARLEQLAGIFLTHEHTDHVRSAYMLSRRYDIPLFANRRTLDCIFREQPETRHHVLDSGASCQLGGLTVQSFPVPHDAADPVGYSVTDRSTGQKIALVTDAGSVTHVMRDATRDANLLILEANHDVHRLHAGPYPGHLKARILGEHGHLSNEAAVGLLCDHARARGPFTVWLAHLSKENNTPKLALGYARATVAVETGCPVVIDVAKRDRPSAHWSPHQSALQLSLFA